MLLVDAPTSATTLDLEENLRISRETIEAITQQFPREKIGISFNGGKDSVVMMELLLRTLGEAYVSECHTFVLDEPEEFDEMVVFRENYIKSRLPNAQLLHASAQQGLREGLWEIKMRTDIEAVFLGTRSADPSGKYQSGPIAPTTSGWPSMLRACPVFHWTYEGVWEYIIACNLPRCPLYECGYTSLGPRSATTRNPNLCKEDGSFLPAWSLSSSDWERCGRSTDSTALVGSPLLKAPTSGNTS